ncbi:autotransporter-associated beta strand repeat-containing protein [Horticoccus luteus]|uniref:Autotransporter-associated beta strand repeat-containing protein n=1 Tax=Horticoccus luteus TaxID=2862869 RepID=A0A8F9TVX4_9BACT|nr:autotransporter-associated beta strand repeat-containing protein [Horticoccus luteus]QYM78981.1 autotransporter-associated beta strand repeat-containing protein [Horticoccus luteus]
MNPSTLLGVLAFARPFRRAHSAPDFRSAVRCVALFVALTAAWPCLTRAASVEWNNTGTDFATGTNWVGGTAPVGDGTTDVATFGAQGGAATSPTVGVNRTVGGLSFLSNAFAYDFAGPGTLRIGSSGVANNAAATQTFSGPLSLNGNQAWTTVAGGALVISGSVDLNPASASSRTLTVAGAGNTTIDGVLSNSFAGSSGNVTVTATGTVLFNGANTYTGVTTVSSGATLKLGHAAALGSTAGGTTVSSGGTLDLNGQAVGAEVVSINGTGVAAAGAVANTAPGAASLAGKLILTGSSTVSVSAGSSLTLGDIDLNASSASARTLSIAGAGDVTLSGNISHSYAGSTGNLTINSTGTVTLSGNNTFTGNAVVSSGATLKIGSATALASSSNYTNVSSGGVLDLNGFDVAKPLRLSASGFDGNGALVNTSDTAVTIAGNVLLAGSSSIGQGDITVNGAVGDAGAGKSLTKRGSGTLTLAGVNTYSGATIVSSGSLLIDGSTAASSAVSVSSGATLGGSGHILGSVTSSGGILNNADHVLSIAGTLATSGASSLASGSTFNVTGGTTVMSGSFAVNGQLGGSLVVDEGATLSGSGFINGATLINDGASLAPGNSPGKLVFGDTLTLSGASITTLQIGATGTAGTDYDAVTVNSLLTFGGTLNVVATDLGGGLYAFAQPGTFNLFSFGSQTGNFATVIVNGVALSFDSGLGSWSVLNLDGFDYTFSLANGQLTAASTSAIPEPSTWAALFGVVALGVAAYGRRRART